MYVSHIVAEITSKSDINEWHHIPGTINAADDYTRVKEIHELTPKCRWISGPQFVTLPVEEWPSFKEDLQVNETELEVRASVLMFVVEWERSVICMVD